jgi:exodeoxyribonuclease-5
MGQRQPRLPGIAVAVAYDANGRIEVIVDWKSGVDIDAERLNTYHRELGAYRRPNGTSPGLLAPMMMRRVIAA